MFDGEVPSLVGETAEGPLHEPVVLRADEQLEQRQRDARGAVRVAGQVLLLLLPEGRHRRPRPGVVVAMGLRQQMLAKTVRLVEITIAAKPLINGAESGDRPGRAADDVERHRLDLVTELAVYEVGRFLFQRRLYEQLLRLQYSHLAANPAAVTP